MINSGSFLYRLASLIGLCAVVVACDPETLLQSTVLDTGQPTATKVIVAQESATIDSTSSSQLTVREAYQNERDWMVDQTIILRGVTNPDVLRAMRAVPRHAFVPDDYQDQAYADHPLPIGYGQTISQPYIVAWMTELLQLKTGDKVLEIGTGSGYQAAVLAELGFLEVYSIEIVPELASQAAERLERLGYDAVRIKEANGYYGWEDFAPYNAIIVTAAPDHLPQPLVQQLADGGVLVVPIGPPGGYQSLWKFIKSGEAIKAINQGGVRFVPFTAGGVKDSSPTLP